MNGFAPLLRVEREKRLQSMCKSRQDDLKDHQAILEAALLKSAPHISVSLGHREKADT